MIKKSKVLLLFILLCVLAVNSCKKDDAQSSISNFLTQSPWNLALLQRFKFVNQALVHTDTIQPACALNQRISFNKDQTFTFSNYGCQTATLNGKWSFTPDQLYLNLTPAVTQNFNNLRNLARINNLGQYSLIFDAGDINTSPKPTDTVVIYRYGFIHSK